MATYDDELARLDALADADDVTAAQRNAARKVRRKLIEAKIAGHMKALEENTAKYAELVQTLAAVIDGIHANRITTALNKVNDLVTAVAEAGKPPGGATG